MPMRDIYYKYISVIEGEFGGLKFVKKKNISVGLVRGEATCVVGARWGVNNATVMCS